MNETRRYAATLNDLTFTSALHFNNLSGEVGFGWQTPQLNDHLSTFVPTNRFVGIDI
ncbi:MAG: hypothetical protein K8T89_26210 [Planctomycetes bacterium]|nr:hypothetical protein [Planctomycetota bacterium]